MVLPIFALALVSAAGPAAPRGCPPGAAIKRQLGVEGASWKVSCKATGDGELDVAALLPPAGPGSAPRIVVAVRRGEARSQAELTLDGLARDGLDRFEGEDWQLSVQPAALKGADWLRLDVTVQSGEDLIVAQTATVFFLEGPRLEPLWTGASDRHEVRFDACRFDTVARFSLSRDGDLVRARRTRRTFRDPGGMDAGTLTSIKAGCLAKPATRETFPVADDGLYAEVTVDPALRARVRRNRLLYLRARESDQAFARFVADSLALLPSLTNAVTDAQPASAEQAAWTVAAPGAFALAVEGGLRNGLAWKNLAEVAKPAGARLIAALRDFDRDDLGAWVEPMTDYGGCHSPSQATRSLRELVAAWQVAPEPVRGAFRDYFGKQLASMTKDGCFCAPKAQLASLQQDLETNAALLDGLPEIGPPAAAQLRALPAAVGATFGCMGPH